MLLRIRESLRLFIPRNAADFMVVSWGRDTGRIDSTGSSTLRIKVAVGQQMTSPESLC